MDTSLDMPKAVKKKKISPTNGHSNGHTKHVATVNELRTKLGLTQQDFATLLGLSIVSVSRWEHGRTKPTEASKMLVGLLARALSQHKPIEVLNILREQQNRGEVARIIALVHLGD